MTILHQLVPVSARVQELKVQQLELDPSSQHQREVVDCQLYLVTQGGSLSLSARVRVKIVMCGLWQARCPDLSTLAPLDDQDPFFW